MQRCQCLRAGIASFPEFCARNGELAIESSKEASLITFLQQ